MNKLITIMLLMCLSFFLEAQQNLPSGIILNDIKNDAVLLEDIVKGEVPVVITFWATWCKSCIEEMEALKDIQEIWEGKIKIVAISVDDSRANTKVKSLVAGNKWPFEIYSDPNKELYRALNITNIPFSIILNNQGKIIFRHTGYSPGGETEMIEKAINSTK